MSAKELRGSGWRDSHDEGWEKASFDEAPGNRAFFKGWRQRLSEGLIALF